MRAERHIGYGVLYWMISYIHISTTSRQWLLPIYNYGTTAELCYVNVAFLFPILNSKLLWWLHLKMTWYWDKVVEYLNFLFLFHLLCISFCILLYWVCIFVNWNPFCEPLFYMRQKENFFWKTLFLRISNHNKCLQNHFFLRRNAFFNYVNF